MIEKPLRVASQSQKNLDVHKMTVEDNLVFANLLAIALWKDDCLFQFPNSIGMQFLESHSNGISPILLNNNLPDGIQTRLAQLIYPSHPPIPTLGIRKKMTLSLNDKRVSLDLRNPTLPTRITLMIPTVCIGYSGNSRV
mgnify:CR=1 FL=1